MSTGKSVYKWTAVDRICNSVMTFGGNIFLARMLDPSDFGLIAMVAIFTALASNISGCGMSDGLINKKHPTETDYSTVYVFNASVGLLFSLSFILLSDYIAAFFGHAELRGIMIAIGICFFFQSLALIQETRMRKELEFKKMAIVRLSATASSLVLAVVLVLNGYSYWGIVAMQVFLSVFLWFYYLVASRWIPRLAFDKRSFKEMFGYGVHLMLAYICYQIARNISTTVLGKFSAASASGAYSQGQKVEEVPFSLSEAILNWPFFAVLSSTSDKDERRKLTSRMHSLIVFVNATIACSLFVVSAFAFNAVFGSKWDAAIPVFRILLLFGLATALKLFYQTILKSHSKTRMIRNLTFAEVVLQLLLLSLFYRCSPEVIALTQTIPVLVALAVYIILYIRLELIDLATFVREMAAVLLPLPVMLLTFAATFTWAGSVDSWIATAAVLSIFFILLIVACECFKPRVYIDLRTRFIKVKEG